MTLREVIERGQYKNPFDGIVDVVSPVRTGKKPTHDALVILVGALYDISRCDILEKDPS